MRGQTAEGPDEVGPEVSMEDAAFETGQTDHGDHEPPEWAIEAAKGELSDDASEEEIRRRAVEMLEQEKGA
jgi:hypothetical protein